MEPDLLRRLLRAKDRIDAHSEREWSIADLARISCLSQAHFARSFKQAFGTPPHRYLLSRRIERAQTMLRDTDLSVTQIALQTGWNSVGTFGRTFKDITGTHPVGKRGICGDSTGDMARIPACVLKACERPPLEKAVSEKRNATKGPTIASHPMENNDD
jgi:transcriptional regulator GlxA family with amidase domain